VTHRCATRVLLLVVALTSPAHAGPLRESRAATPSFALDALDGTRVRLRDLAGKVVVVSFWATWCAPCLQELPFLDRYQRELAERGLVVLAIATDGPKTRAQVRTVVQRKRLGMPVLLDEDGAVAADLNPRGAMPYTLYVDRAGRVAADHEGFTSGDEVAMRETLEALLAEK
jgi:peroxiredoxin